MVIIFQLFTDTGKGWKTGFISEREEIRYNSPRCSSERKACLSESMRERERESEGGGRGQGEITWGNMCRRTAILLHKVAVVLVRAGQEQ